MKNIMFQNSSPDGGSYVFIDDLNRLDTFANNQYTPKDISDVKELIEFIINNPRGSKSFSRGSGWNNQFGVSGGDVYDENGYFMINLLHDCFGFTQPPFTIEHVICSHSYI